MMRIVFLLMLLCLPLDTVLAFERAKVSIPRTAPLTLTCIADAAKAGGLPLAALVGILAAEGGKTGEALSNANGTWDMGGFQINTVHINELAAMGIEPEQVLGDGCVNAHAAAWVLKREYARTGDIWQAVGAYHSRTPHRRDAYIARVKGHLLRLGKHGLHSLRSLDHDMRGDP